MNIALVGLGYWGPNLLRVLNKIGVLRKAYDFDKDKINKFSSDPSYKHIKFGTAYKNALGADIDAIVIATPPNTHHDIAVAAMNAGKHVFIEKPMTIDVTEAENLVKLAASLDLILMVGHVFLYVPEVLKLKEIIDSGEIGDLLYIHASRLNLGKFQKSNVIADLAPHDISIFNFLVESEVTRVFSNGYGFINKDIVEVAKIVFEYKSGVVCDLHLSWLDPRKKRTTTVVGSKKMVVYDMMSDEKIKIYDKGVEPTDPTDTAAHAAYLLSYRHGDIHSPQTEIYEPLEKECSYFIDCVVNHKKPLTDGYNGLSVVKVLNGALDSLRLGEWQSIN